MNALVFICVNDYLDKKHSYRFLTDDRWTESREAKQRNGHHWKTGRKLGKEIARRKLGVKDEKKNKRDVKEKLNIAGKDMKENGMT